MSRPLVNVAHSGLDRPPPRTDAPGLPLTRRAHRRAVWYASAGIAPIAVANESMNRRLASWTASAVSRSKVSPAAYRARRAASGNAAMRRPHGERVNRGDVLRAEPGGSGGGDT